MKRSEKIDFVKKLKEELNNSSSVIVAHYDGLSVAETDNLRKEMRKNGTKFKVTKNRLTKLALEQTPILLKLSGGGPRGVGSNGHSKIM